MSLHGSALAAAGFRTWLLHPTGPEVTSGCVGWTKHPWANPLAYWVRSLLPETLAHQVKGVNWRWGLLIGDGNCFPLPMCIITGEKVSQNHRRESKPHAPV